MVQINFAQKQINAKIVFYGPGMSGKTTNLEIVHQRAPEANRGELTSISTDGDRTLFFDFMPLDLGTVAGMRTCFQIYTVPGQVYYNSTRKLVLQGVDGVIFVADSSAAMTEENLESLRNLEENLNEYGKSVTTLPIVIQYNKRDLPDALPVEDLNAQLNPSGRPYFEAIASSGKGVFPTLKALAAQVLESIHQNQGAPSGTEAAAPGIAAAAPVASANTGFYAAQPQAPAAQAPMAQPPAGQPLAPPMTADAPGFPQPNQPLAPAAQAQPMAGAPAFPAPPQTGVQPVAPGQFAPAPGAPAPAAMGNGNPAAPQVMPQAPSGLPPAPQVQPVQQPAPSADPLARTTIHPPPTQAPQVGAAGADAGAAAAAPPDGALRMAPIEATPSQQVGMARDRAPVATRTQATSPAPSPASNMMGVEPGSVPAPPTPAARSFQAPRPEAPRFKPRVAGNSAKGKSEGGQRSAVLTGIFVTAALAVGALLGSFVLSLI